MIIGLKSTDLRSDLRPGDIFQTIDNGLHHFGGEATGNSAYTVFSHETAAPETQNRARDKARARKFGKKGNTLIREKSGRHGLNGKGESHLWDHTTIKKGSQISLTARFFINSFWRTAVQILRSPTEAFRDWMRSCPERIRDSRWFRVPGRRSLRWTVDGCWRLKLS